MKKLFIVMLSVFALMLVGCSNPAGSDGKPAPDPYLLGLDDCEVTLAEIETGVQDDWEYDYTIIVYIAGVEPATSTSQTKGSTIKDMENRLSSDGNYTDFKYYTNTNFSTIVMKYKNAQNSRMNCYIQYIKTSNGTSE